MKMLFAFTDESGQYQKDRREKFIRAHPFYVRSTVIISLTDYLLLQNRLDEIKAAFGLHTNVEVKWSHYGNAIKNNYNDVPHQLSPEQLKNYYSQVLSVLCELGSVSAYYTITDNSALGRVDEIALLKMHLQNALQRVQKTASECDGFAIVVADDLNDKTKTLKQAVYNLTLSGDFVEYTNIKKGLYIDFSNQCPGLQIADICAGVFTTSLKYISAIGNEKKKYECGYELFFEHAYKKTRNNLYNCPYYEVYKHGVKEVPNRAGDTIAKEISHLVEQNLQSDLLRDVYD